MIGLGFKVFCPPLARKNDLGPGSWNLAAWILVWGNIKHPPAFAMLRPGGPSNAEQRMETLLAGTNCRFVWSGVLLNIVRIGRVPAWKSERGVQAASLSNTKAGMGLHAFPVIGFSG
jgi:hypothetical protein